jgi:putative cell wall-binding protein
MSSAIRTRTHRPVLLALLLVLTLLLPAAPGAAQAPGPAPGASADPPAVAAAGEPGARLAGPDRVATAVALSRHGWSTAEAAVLVRSDAFADALAAGMLADRLGGPLLLTARDALSSATEAELRRLRVARVVIVGGTSAVGQAVESGVRSLGAAVRRIAGADRFATAAAVSAEIGAEPSAVLLARGASADPLRAWPDALSGGAFAALDAPAALLLAADGLPSATRDRLAALGRPVTILGGPPAVSDAVDQEVASLVPSTRRLSGPDRYATSRAVAAAVLDGLPSAPRPLVVASGANYPDALAAAALAGRTGGVLLLTPPSGLDPQGEAAAWLRGHRGRFSRLLVAGGANVLPDRALVTLAEASGTTAPAPVSVDELRLPARGDRVGPSWRRAFTIPYGPGVDRLGTEPGGDGQGLVVGPQHGAQAGDGSWWILDVAKLRVAHFDERGRHLGQVALGPDVLRDGRYMPYERPRVLADGSVVATALTGDDRTEVLVVREGRAQRLVWPQPLHVVDDDGTRLYGVDVRTGAAFAADLASGRMTPVSAFRGRDGQPYTVTATRGQLRVTRPAVGQSRSLPVLAAPPPGGPAGYAVQLATGSDGEIHLFLEGYATTHPNPAVGGITTVRADGTVAPAEPVLRDDPRMLRTMGAWVGTRPGTSEAWLMVVEIDGLHVYRRIS